MRVFRATVPGSVRHHCWSRVLAGVAACPGPMLWCGALFWFGWRLSWVLRHARFLPCGAGLLGFAYNRNCWTFRWVPCWAEERYVVGWHAFLFCMWLTVSVVTYAVFSADGASVLTVSYDSSARIWSSAFEECLLTLAGHENVITSAVLSADGASVHSGFQRF